MLSGALVHSTRGEISHTGGAFTHVGGGLQFALFWCFLFTVGLPSIGLDDPGEVSGKTDTHCIVHST